MEEIGRVIGRVIGRETTLAKQEATLAKQEEENYDDIIDLPHHVSKRHQRMSMLSRAKQFAPFNALSSFYSDVNVGNGAVGDKRGSKTVLPLDDGASLEGEPL